MQNGVAVLQKVSEKSGDVLEKGDIEQAYEISPGTYVPVYPDELEAVPSVLEQAGFPVSGLLATHGDWDHLLGRLAFPDASLGCAESTARRLQATVGAAQRGLREFDSEHYVTGRGPVPPPHRR